MNHAVTTPAARLLGAGLRGLRALLVLSLLTGVAYPLAVTGVAQGLFPDRANGSEITSGGKVVGSALIGQSYDLPPKKDGQSAEPDLRWFQGRPHDGQGTNSVNTRYHLILSGATNLSADNEELVRSVEAAKAAVVRVNSTDDYRVSAKDVPPDAVTSSGSGLDPHISPRYATLQVHRVAEHNDLTVRQVRDLVAAHTQGRDLGFLGEPRVNVLELNVALRELTAGS